MGKAQDAILIGIYLFTSYSVLAASRKDNPVFCFWIVSSLSMFENAHREWGREKLDNEQICC